MEEAIYALVSQRYYDSSTSTPDPPPATISSAWLIAPFLPMWDVPRSSAEWDPSPMLAGHGRKLSLPELPQTTLRGTITAGVWGAQYATRMHAYSSLAGALDGQQESYGVRQAPQNMSQYHGGTEQITIVDDPATFSMLLPAQTDQAGIVGDEHGQAAQTYQYEAFEGRYSTVIVHPEPTIGVEEAGPANASTSAPSTSRLYNVAAKYRGSRLPHRLPRHDKPLGRRKKGEVVKKKEKLPKKGANESCLICSAFKKSCPAELGGLCPDCENATTGPLPTIFRPPERRTGIRSRLNGLIDTAERTFRLGSYDLSPQEEGVLKQVAKIAEHRGKIHFLPSGAFILVCDLPPCRG
ncbi:hypothetical protein OBBRIDRAFT_797230 [Obba rivulosa]|uniref:Uncharacterized protein n=1 Tax=Obba rivulosa TaxID=1052685 RepID=A0A8E2AKR0_9APHY|nr:hypothetical protein OBBRIDRAFT_797230 [Obba rivulosa]